MNYTIDGTRYNREIFTSYPDQVMVIRLTASEKKSIFFKAYLDRAETRNLDEMKAVSSDSIMMVGKTGGKDGITFCSLVQAFSDRKSTRLNSSHVAISYAVCC